MPLVQIETFINADIQTCFDLARNVDFYQKSIKNSREIAIDGKTTGLVEANDFITWEAKHLGFVRHITLKVTEFNNPSLFVDEIVEGDFKAYKHEHIFRKSNNKTIMIDKFYFESNWGVLGKIVDKFFMKKYMINILKIRNKTLKEKAEKIQLESIS
ncbi:SRPBCC family protein [uncultured Algibacter sp.]|uniref:SRPBCC family protein n=1 Tax=uncultured Algibacter sp. TaxID=298659 RepID=UPI00260A3FDF|nr:SRPBCC family protein [uncultured Algibacter sp.]